MEEAFRGWDLLGVVLTMVLALKALRTFFFSFSTTTTKLVSMVEVSPFFLFFYYCHVCVGFLEAIYPMPFVQFSSIKP